MNAVPVNVRFPPNELRTIDKWIEDQQDDPTRPEAIRRLVKGVLGGGK